MVKIIEGKDLYDEINKYDIILIGTNIYCSMSQGFQRKVMLNYPYVQDMNMETKYGDETKLGTIIECKKNENPTFVLCYINKGNFRPDLKSDYLSYESLEKCIKLINVLYKGKKIACTVMGASKFDGNGNKEKIIDILSQNSPNLDLYVYDYTQLSRSEEMKKIRDYELKLKKIDLEAYYKAVKKRKEDADKRKKNNGHARY